MFSSKEPAVPAATRPKYIIVISPPAARSPIVQVAVGTSKSSVPGMNTPVSVIPAGKISVTTTPVASEGPAFVTVTVYSIVSPSAWKKPRADLDTERSAVGTKNVAVSELKVRSGSAASEAVISAMFSIKVPPVPASTVASIVRVSTAPTSMPPTVQTPVPSTYAPVVTVELTNATPGGNKSVTSTPVASDGPAFETVMT